ncbi:MAG: hypothetical protein JXM79_01190 [Sedimentisphaerales bacterium]|nr:hypothetical protein [Sedimentisphaerales bacterium]
MKKDCMKMQDKMADLIFGTLSRHEKQALDDHIAGCLECWEYLQTLKDEQSVLRGFTGKVEAGMKQREERMLDAIRHCTIETSAEPMTARQTFNFLRISKLAVAAVLLIATGYFAGHFFASPSVDIEELRAALEPAIRRNLEEQMKQNFELALHRHVTQLKEDLAGQFHREMKEFSARTLVASRMATEQRLIELVQLIEATRAVDHRQIAAALERIETHRLYDKTRLGEGLIKLAAQKNEMSGDSPDSSN